MLRAHRFHHAANDTADKTGPELILPVLKAVRSSLLQIAWGPYPGRGFIKLGHGQTSSTARWNPGRTRPVTYCKTSAYAVRTRPFATNPDFRWCFALHQI